MKKSVDAITSNAIDSLVDVFGGADVLIRAAFAHSYFICPEAVRNKTPYYPNHARYSRKHYPNKKKNEKDIWRAGDGRDVTLDDNSRAQSAWEKYTGHSIIRKSGYSVRHIWGNPWNPDAYTAGWNLCYMPFWAGMLTEDQHPIKELQSAICQASWDLYFEKNPVCKKPDFVKNPGLDLNDILQGQSLLILSKPQRQETSEQLKFNSLEESLTHIRKISSQSWSNLYKATRMLQDKQHEDFGTKNVESSSKSTIRRILKAANSDCCSKNLAKLESLITQHIT